MPAGLTLEQLKAKGAKPAAAPTQGLTLQQLQAAGAKPAAAPAPQPTGLFSRIKTGVSQAFTERDKKVAEAASKVNQGKQSKTEGILQATGQAAGLVTDTAMVAAKEAVRSVAPSAIPAIKRTISSVAETKPVQKVVEKYGEFKEAHPRAAANVEAGVNIAGVLPTIKGAQIAGKTAAKGALTAAETGVDAAIKTGQAAKKLPAGAASVLTNVPRDVFERAANPEWTPLIEKAIKHVSENERQPYFDLAKRTSEALNVAEEQAARRLGHEKMFFRSDNPGATFDVASKYEDIVMALKPYRSSGIVVDGDKGARGKIVDYRISQTPQSSFTSREVEKLNGLLDKLKVSTDVEIDDLLSLRQSFSTAYDEIPLGVNGDPRPYHAAVMSMKTAAEQTIDRILPPNLKEAFAQYRVLEEMKSAIGNKVIDGKGEMKDSAEQFFSNLSNINKGNVRSSAEDLKAITGIDITREVQALKDAQKLSENFARTGSRSQDILRAILATGMGSVSGGLPGMFAALAATSPKVVGKAALGVGKMRGSKAGKSVGEYVKNVQPGLSVKDVSGITREKLDQVRDFLIDQLPKSSGKLNLEIEQEAADFVDYLKDAKAISSQDVNRALEILRLQGKTDIIERLRGQLGAAAQYNRDNVGRFAPKILSDALRRN
jgi:hypothetical protein